MGEVGETMSGTGDNSLFSKLGLQRQKVSILKQSPKDKICHNAMLPNAML